MIDIASWFFMAMLKIVMVTVQIILLPIDTFIATILPDVYSMFTNIGAFLNYLAEGIGWAISASGIPYYSISILATYMIFALTIPIHLWVLKLAVKWYGALKP